MRFDRLPMDRSAQSAGSGEALFERREVDPSYPLTQKRRPGSLRQDDYSAAPGLRCEADAAYGYWPTPINVASNGISVVGSIQIPDMPGGARIPIVRLFSSEDNSSELDSIRLELYEVSAGVYGLDYIWQDSLGAEQNNLRSGFSVGDQVDFEFSSNAARSQAIFATAVNGGALAGGTAFTPSGTYATSTFYLSVLGGDDGAAKPAGESPVVSNIAIWQQVIAAASVLGGGNTLLRDPQHSGVNSDWYWSMRDPYRVMASEGDETGLLFLHPAPPAIASSAAQFGGRSGAIAIEGSLDTERFFSTAAEAVADKEFTIYLKGTRGNRGATSREEILFDYGDLAQIHFNATTNTVDFIYNGVTASSDAVAPGAAFEIYAGRNGSTLFCYVVGGTEGTDSTNPAAPFLDYSAAPTIYIGAEADVTQDTRYVGSLTKVALWPERTLTDLGARTAAFYLDLSDAIEDKSPNGAAVTEEIHSSDSGDPHFVAGPIDDAAHRTCEGGLVLGDSGPVASGWDVALDKRIEGDATGIRFGRRVIVTSQDSAHVLDSEAKIGRPFGIPQPPPGVSTTALGSGPLDGVYSYGYRFLSRDGTYGPVRRLDPVKATSGARVVVGSTGGTGESELGETYGYIPASTASSFYKDFTADPGAGNFTAEVYARLLNHDPEEVEEDVMERGLVTTGNGISFLKSGSPSPIDLGDDFTIQCDFRYRRRNGLSVDGIVSTLICGFGSDNTDENADFFAALIGSDDDDSAQSKYTSRFPNNTGGTHYGDGETTDARLVVGIPRRKIRADREFGSGRNFPSENYFLATFTDDATWTDGSDYSVIFARTGDDLRVLVRNRTTGGAYTELTGRTMATSGVATSGGGTGAADGYGSAKFSGTDTRSFSYSSGSGGDFFKDWSPKLSSRKAWFGNAGRRIVIPFISNEAGTKGVPEHADHRYPDGAIPELDIDELDCSLKAFDDDTEMYQFRAWSQYISPPILAGHANRRFAAREEEPLNGGIVHDVACVVEDVSGFTRKLQDVASGQIFSVYKSFNELVKATYFAQDNASLQPDKQYFYVMEDTASPTPGSAIEFYWTSEGNGSWRLGVNGEEYYNILGRTAEPFNANASQRIVSRDTAGINDILAPDDEYNWFSFEQRTLSSGDTLVQILNLAVNGAPLFTVNIGGVTTQAEGTSGPNIHIGGWDQVTGDKEVAVGEFRFWGDGLGPDPETGDDFDYLGGRVSENEFGNLLSYLKFQPVDLISGGGLVRDYGSDSGLVIPQGTATITDPRGTAGLIGFPSAPAEYVTGVEILRSVGISVQDPEDESEVQEALDEARGAPLYRLAVIPTGSSHYVDSASDGALGFEVDTRTGYVPQVIKGAFIWQGQIGLAGDRTTLHFAEPGPFGWESYPRWLDYEVPGAGGDLTAATSAGNLAYAFGKTWAVAMAGSPSNPEPVGLGGGVGATDQRSVAAWGDKLFAHNGQLWHIQGAQAVDIGGPVRDLLPAAGSCRLVVSALLSSLLVIDTSSGLVLRFYFPTGQWSIEDRYVLAAGDLADGSATAFISLSGTYSQSSSSYVADDVEASTDTSGSGTLSGDTVTLGANITIPTLCRIQVEDANGVTAAAVASESGSTGTLTFPANSMSALAAGAVTVRPGVPAEGALLDTGYIKQGYTGHNEGILHTVDSGSGWEVSTSGSATAGGRASRSGLSFVGISGTGERHGGGHGDRYLRVVVRNLSAEFGEIGSLEVDSATGGMAR